MLFEKHERDCVMTSEQEKTDDSVVEAENAAVEAENAWVKVGRYIHRHRFSLVEIALVFVASLLVGVIIGQFAPKLGDEISEPEPGSISAKNVEIAELQKELADVRAAAKDKERRTIGELISLRTGKEDAEGKLRVLEGALVGLEANVMGNVASENDEYDISMEIMEEKVKKALQERNKALECMHAFRNKALLDVSPTTEKPFSFKKKFDIKDIAINELPSGKRFVRVFTDDTIDGEKFSLFCVVTKNEVRIINSCTWLRIIEDDVCVKGGMEMHCGERYRIIYLLTPEFNKK